MKYIYIIIYCIILSSCWTSKTTRIKTSDVGHGTSITQETASFGASSFDMLSSMHIDSIFFELAIDSNLTEKDSTTLPSKKRSIRGKAYGVKKNTGSSGVISKGEVNEISFNEFELKSDSAYEIKDKSNNNDFFNVDDFVTIFLFGILIIFVLYGNKFI